MPNLPDIEHRTRIAGIVSLLTVLMGAWFLIMPIGESLRQASFDAYLSIPGAAAQPPSPSPVVVIYLDLESYLHRGLDPLRPWPRALHAQLLDRLTRAGARAVAIDILFGTAETNAPEDLVLQMAIRRNGRVFLAGEIGTQSQGMDPNRTPWSKEARLELPDPLFLEAAAGWGLADVRPDRDFVVRRQYSGWPEDIKNRPSLAWAVGRHLGLPSTSFEGEWNPMNRWMRYYGPAMSIPHVSMDQALSDQSIPDDWFKDKVVFVGARPMSGNFPDRRDEYRSPFRSWSESDLFHPGVEIHATQLTNLIQNEWLRQPPPMVELGCVVVTGMVLGFGLVGRKPSEATVICLAIGLLVILGAAIVYRHGNLWVPWLMVPAIQIPCAFTGTVLAHWHGWLQTKRRLEAEVHRAQRMEAIGALAGGMAHDLNNSLAPVLLGVQLLRRENLSENNRKLVDLMESSVLRGVSMVQQVLLFARGQSAPVESLDIQRLVREMASLATDTFPKNIHVSSHIPNPLWPIRGNATELHQVLLNLAVNARDAMPAGGSLCFSAENVDLDVTQSAQYPEATPGQYVAIMVSDTGTGIAPEVLAKMFEPFFTTKPVGQGTGLGLSTAQRVVQKHGGFLQVSSVVGEGTTIEVFLPRHKADEIAATPKAPETSIRGRGESIWIIEDDIAVLEMIRRGLLDQGYAPQSAANGAEVGSLSQRGYPPAVILCDADMPLPDGSYVWESLRAAHPNVFLILMGIEDDASRGSHVRGIQKPIDWESLMRLLQTYERS